MRWFSEAVREAIRLGWYPQQHWWRAPSLRYGAGVMVKGSKRFAATGGWGFFDFNHFEPKAPTAKVRAEAECAYCHMAGAKKDQVSTQFYRLLDD
jgi:hypothetical protein